MQVGQRLAQRAAYPCRPSDDWSRSMYAAMVRIHVPAVVTRPAQRACSPRLVSQTMFMAFMTARQHAKSGRPSLNRDLGRQDHPLSGDSGSSRLIEQTSLVVLPQHSQSSEVATSVPSRNRGLRVTRQQVRPRRGGSDTPDSLLPACYPVRTRSQQSTFSRRLGFQLSKSTVASIRIPSLCPCN